MNATPIYSPQESEQRILQKVAEDYIQRGYTVSIEPQEVERPDFLKLYRLDLLARSPNDNVVVEMKRRNGASRMQWKDIAERIQQHPGWRLELVFGDSSEEQIPDSSAPIMTFDEIVASIATARNLAEQNALKAAYLTAWLALTGAMRLVVQNEGLSKEVLLERGLAARLYSEGWLERDSYDQILHAERTRNQVVHGFQAEDLELLSVETVCAVAERLLWDWKDWLEKKEEAA
jgi:hypothetical protein